MNTMAIRQKQKHIWHRTKASELRRKTHAFDKV